MFDLLIKGCDVLTLDGLQPRILSGQAIAVQEQRIAAVEPAERIEAAEARQVIPAHGLLAIPGLINTHAHVPMVLFRGLVEDVTIQEWFNDYIWPLESNLTPDDVFWGALLGMAEMIECGVTHVADHYFFMDQVAEAADAAGMRVNLAWAIFGEEMLDSTCRFIERWQGKANERITTWLGPHAPYTCGANFLRLAAQRAREMGVGIHIHVSETAEQVQLSLQEHGITPVQMLAETGVLERPTILAHCLHPTDDDIRLLSQTPCGIAHAPKTYMKLGMGTAPLAKLRAAGVSVGLATDGASSSNSLDILEQMRLAALAQKDAAHSSTVQTVGETLDLAFHGGARVMRMAGDLGEISPGKLADLALLRQDGLHVFPRFDPAANLVYSSRAGDVHTVICDGKVLMQDGRLLTIDKSLVKREVASRLERLSERVPGRRIATYPA